jgi:pyruvate/2-oxoglutarate dehydrogenase complex dihydrolipoamide dehydrogenase (E3) component
MKNYDIVVIGSGSGGLTAAYTALGFGKKVLVIDKNLPGGECTWSGCIPSKALINEAKKVHQARQVVGDFDYDTRQAMEKVQRVIQTVYKGESIEKLIKDGIDFIQGHATFSSAHEVRVGDQLIKSKKFVIATGSSPLKPPIPGLSDIRHLDNDTLFKLETLPKSMIILGGGAIGVEMAQAMNRLGVKVDLVEMAETILFREEKEYALRLQNILRDEGVRIHVGAKAVNMFESGENIVLEVEKKGEKLAINANEILVAIGRAANVNGIGLDQAGIEYDRRHIIVNEKMETSQKHIYAIGDVAGPYLFSHMANVQGIQAIQNAFLPINRKVSYDHVAWTTFSEPELARAGMTEAEARASHEGVRVYTFDFNHLDRAMTKGHSDEGVKIILDKKGKVLGATVLADRAGEMISEIQLLKTMKLNFSKLVGVIHPYPTYGEVFNKIAKKVAVDNLLQNPIVKLFRK